jgi:hypothetical protein
LYCRGSYSVIIVVVVFELSLISLHSYSLGEISSPVLVKYEHFLYINSTPPYRNAMDILNFDIHKILVFRKAEVG